MRNVITLGEQIKQFSTVRDTIATIMGPTETEEFLAKSLFFISIGSNDIFLYYYSNSTVPKQEFIATLGSAYENQLKNLMGLGARKFGIISVPPIGCCPSQRVRSGTGECLEVLNELAVAFHSQLRAMLKKLSSEHESMKYSLGNAYNMTIDVNVNPLPFFKDVKSACCGSGALNAEGICDPNARLCLKRHEYLFWDLYHPTHTASKLAAVTLFTGGPRYVTPMNFSQLVSAC
ncbi:GDSL esterase/lipase At4g28780-like [Rhodamnia argentea]|uniref:GDSL esterase/lipase At4g28780-like n=1 Tax=Rhodamnia argentea TaxID=178133 RepID=A0ABM3GVG9_9MYRT|nr:GDSL esterase/lipase At4g28780-like [Rhodamnia argentea]